MFSSFKSLFISKPKEDNEKNNQENNSDLADQNTSEKTTEVEKEEEKMRFILAMDIFKEQDLTRKSFEISLYDSVKMYEKFHLEILKNWG